MTKRLGEDLDPIEKAYLGNLIHHEGFKVLLKMTKDYCRQTADAVIALDPTDDKYEVKLKTLQIYARVANDFCSSLFDSANWHIGESLAIQEQKEIDALLNR